MGKTIQQKDMDKVSNERKLQGVQLCSSSFFQKLGIFHENSVFHDIFYGANVKLPIMYVSHSDGQLDNRLIIEGKA